MIVNKFLLYTALAIRLAAFSALPNFKENWSYVNRVVATEKVIQTVSMIILISKRRCVISRIEVHALLVCCTEE